VTVQPKIKGMYEATRAKIKYNPSTIVMEDVAPDLRSGFSTSLGKIQIISVSEQTRLANKVTRDWLLLVAAVVIILLLIVYLLKSFHTSEVAEVVVEEQPQPKSTKRKSN
jgi:Translocon-associated protein beta (TRAPB)